MNENLAAFPIVDIFAGPGGLGEGFATLENPSGGRAFKSVISIERDEFAHQTLHLRHFLRAFSETISHLNIMNTFQEKSLNKISMGCIHYSENTQTVQH